MIRKLMYFIFLTLTIMILIHAQDVIIYTKQSLLLCYEIIIPSLFPFFVCSGLLTYSGFSQMISKLFTPIMEPIFRINGSGASAFILGLISGYPLGAITACSLYENKSINKLETERLLAFCNNSGPLFILGSVGISLYNSPIIGWILYLSHILSAISVGFLFRFYKQESCNHKNQQPTSPTRPIPEVISLVLKNSVSNVLTVCGTIVFFSVVAHLLTNELEFPALMTGLIEFVSGTVGISNSNLDILYKLLLSSFIVGFAGISVHIQVMGIVSKHKLSLKPYFMGKILHGCFAVIYTYFMINLLPIKLPTFGQVPLNINGGFAISSLFMISTVFAIFALCLIFSTLIYFQKSINYKQSFTQ